MLRCVLAANVEADFVAEAQVEYEQEVKTIQAETPTVDSGSDEDSANKNSLHHKC